VSSSSTSTSLRHSNGSSSNGTQRSDAILAAATTAFARNGYRNTDVQAVADSAKVGKGTVYRQFPTKEELFLATVDRAMWQLHEAVQASAAKERNPLDQVKAAIRAYLDYFAQHPDVVELLIQERAEFRDRVKPTYFVHRDANMGPWRQLFQKLIAAGRVRDIPVDRITDAMSGLMYGTMFINFFGGRKKSSSSQADELLDIVFNGILTPQEQTGSKRKSR